MTMAKNITIWGNVVLKKLFITFILWLHYFYLSGGVQCDIFVIIFSSFSNFVFLLGVM